MTIPLAASWRRRGTVDFLTDSPNSSPSALSPFFQEAWMALAFLPGFLLLIQIPLLFPLQMLHRQIERQIVLCVRHDQRTIQNLHFLPRDIPVCAPVPMRLSASLLQACSRISNISTTWELVRNALSGLPKPYGVRIYLLTRCSGTHRHSKDQEALCPVQVSS